MFTPYEVVILTTFPSGSTISLSLAISSLSSSISCWCWFIAKNNLLFVWGRIRHIARGLNGLVFKNQSQWLIFKIFLETISLFESLVNMEKTNNRCLKGTSEKGCSWNGLFGESVFGGLDFQSFWIRTVLRRCYLLVSELLILLAFPAGLFRITLPRRHSDPCCMLGCWGYYVV